MNWVLTAMYKTFGTDIVLSNALLVILRIRLGTGGFLSRILRPSLLSVFKYCWYRICFQPFKVKISNWCALGPVLSASPHKILAIYQNLQSLLCIWIIDVENLSMISPQPNRYGTFKHQIIFDIGSYRRIWLTGLLNQTIL